MINIKRNPKCRIGKCKKCHRPIDNRAKSKLCIDCWYKFAVGKNAIFYGKHHTKKTKKKLKIINIGNKHAFENGKPKCIDCGKEIWYDSKRCVQCFHIILSKKFKGKKPSKKCIEAARIANSHPMSDENKDKIRKSLLGKNKGKKSALFGKPAPFIKKIKYKGIKMRSSWEVAYAKYLDKQGIKWEYEPKAFDLGETTYTPDFYLPESDTYVEIKGRWFKDSKKKFNLFRKKYYSVNIILLTRKELIKLKIIKE
jgi:hypothetical protein